MAVQAPRSSTLAMRGIQVGLEAKRLDNNKEYRVAYLYYCSAANILLGSLEDPNWADKSLMQVVVSSSKEYMERAKYISDNFLSSGEMGKKIDYSQLPQRSVPKPPPRKPHFASLKSKLGDGKSSPTSEKAYEDSKDSFVETAQPKFSNVNSPNVAAQKRENQSPRPPQKTHSPKVTQPARPVTSGRFVPQPQGLKQTPQASPPQQQQQQKVQSNFLLGKNSRPPSAPPPHAPSRLQSTVPQPQPAIAIRRPAPPPPIQKAQKAQPATPPKKVQQTPPLPPPPAPPRAPSGGQPTDVVRKSALPLPVQKVQSTPSWKKEEASKSRPAFTSKSLTQKNQSAQTALEGLPSKPSQPPPRPPPRSPAGMPSKNFDQTSAKTSSTAKTVVVTKTSVTTTTAPAKASKPLPLPPSSASSSTPKSASSIPAKPTSLIRSILPRSGSNSNRSNRYSKNFGSTPRKVNSVASRWPPANTETKEQPKSSGFHVLQRFKEPHQLKKSKIKPFSGSEKKPEPPPRSHIHRTNYEPRPLQPQQQQQQSIPPKPKPLITAKPKFLGASKTTKDMSRTSSEHQNRSVNKPSVLGAHGKSQGSRPLPSMPIKHPPPDSETIAKLIVQSVSKSTKESLGKTVTVKSLKSDEDGHTTGETTEEIARHTITIGKDTFEVIDHSPQTFHMLRETLALQDMSYLRSFTNGQLDGLRATGKSGSFFYQTKDKRFIIKSINEEEHKCLIEITQDYFVVKKKCVYIY